MAKQTNLYLTQSVKTAAVVIQPAHTTTYRTLFTAGTNDSYIECITACSDDTSTRYVTLALDDGASQHIIGTTAVVAGSGTDGTNPAIDLLNYATAPGLPLNANGKRYIKLATGWSLKVKVITTMTAAKTMYVTMMGEDF